ncbi:MAG: 5'-3' exonuclease H3TH domain-containing protein, partial [Simkaniaceae bacterium]|nr:5'-3' exonuclease H3TH domain-containing protein [Simkaniaceae bacterium]
MKKLYILDAVAYLFRSFYAIRGMSTPSGEATNALYGFIRSVQKIITEFSPDAIVAVFDGPNNKASRTAIYEDYKSHREKMPEDLYSQLQRALEYCEIADIPHLSISGVEADDTIGTIAKWAETQGATSYICSSDKDLCQLINNNTSLLNTGKGNLLINREKVKELYGVFPEQVVDYLAIMGDASDGIPGIPGFGAKTAANLLEKYGTLDYILEHPDEVTSPKKAATIRENKDIALLSRKLATLQLDVEVPKDPEFYKVKEIPREKILAFYRELNFTTFLKENGEVPTPSAKKGAYHLVDDEKSLNDLIEKLQNAPEVCVDTETTSLNTLETQIVGIGFCIEKGDAYYVPTNGSLGLAHVITTLKPLLESEKIAWIGHNLKYDMHAFANHGITLRNIASDTMVASYILRPDRTRHSLDALTLELFDHRMTPIKTLIGTGKKQISMLDVPIAQVSDYCCEDVDYTLQL